MMRGLVFFLLALGVAGPALALDRDGNYFVRGAGNELCAAYDGARERQQDAAFQDWLAGYISSFDRWTADVWRIEHGDFESSLRWVDYYCHSHPSATFEMAAQNLIAFLYPNRLRTARGEPPPAYAPPYDGSSVPPR